MLILGSLDAGVTPLSLLLSIVQLVGGGGGFTSGLVSFGDTAALLRRELGLF